MRSKVLLISNIFATILVAIITYVTVTAINDLGGMEGLEAYSELYSYSIAKADFITGYILTMPYLLIAQASIFVVATLFGWISYLAKKSGLAKFAAVLYILGALSCFYYFTFFAIPVIVLGFVGGSKQKSLNKANAVSAPVIKE